MSQFGIASVYGVDGSIAYAGATAIYAIPDQIEQEQDAQFDEFKSGINQLLGWYKTDERMSATITLLPKADTIAHAVTSLVAPVGPCKVSITGVLNELAWDAVGADIRQVNGDYIYVKGFTRTRVRGQATIRLPIFRPLDVVSTYLVGGAVTPAAITAYINALVTAITA